MAESYSDDLRRKLLEAYDRGEGTLEELAEQFGVSAPWAWKISAQRKRTGQMERVEQRHGPESKVSEEIREQFRDWVRQQPDLTLQELQQRLERTRGLHVSIGRLWQVLQRLKLRLKKNRSMPRSRTRPQPANAGRRGGRR